MPRTKEDKQAIVADLKRLLSESQMAVVIEYKGLSVAEITNLRRSLRATGAVCKVTKNTLMKRAVDGDRKWESIEPLLKDASAFLLLKDDLSGAIKAYQEFQKTTKKTELRGGVLEGKLLTEADVTAIGDLPSKEQLYAQIAGALNAVTAKLAIGIKEVPASLARGLQAYADKDNKQDSNAA